MVKEKKVLPPIESFPTRPDSGSGARVSVGPTPKVLKPRMSWGPPRKKWSLMRDVPVWRERPARAVQLKAAFENGSGNVYWMATS